MKQPWTKWRSGKLERGLCTECGKEPLDLALSTCRCAKCTDRRKIRRGELKRTRKENGLCPYCGEVAQKGRVTCGQCRVSKKHRRSKHRPSSFYKAQFLEMYGDKCQCCGESNPSFLTADHVNRDGAEERKKSKRASGYQQYLREKREDIQVLCFNCNCGRELHNGICPHKIVEQVVEGLKHRSMSGF